MCDQLCFGRFQPSNLNGYNSIISGTSANFNTILEFECKPSGRAKTVQLKPYDNIFLLIKIREKPINANDKIVKSQKTFFSKLMIVAFLYFLCLGIG